MNYENNFSSNQHDEGTAASRRKQKNEVELISAHVVVVNPAQSG